MICNFDCSNCTYDDCINDELRDEDFVAGEQLEKELALEEKLKNMTPRQRTIYKYNHSDKRKKASQRYDKSEKGKAAQKNATKKYYTKHSEEIKKKAREEYYTKKKQRKPEGVVKEPRTIKLNFDFEDKFYYEFHGKVLYDFVKKIFVTPKGVFYYGGTGKFFTDDDINDTIFRTEEVLLFIKDRKAQMERDGK